MNKTLAFDVYGTLINTEGVYKTLTRMVGDRAKPLMDAWRSKQLEYSFRRGLMGTYVDFSVCTIQALEFCCESMKISISNEQQDAIMDEYKTLPAYEEVRSGLEQLRKAGNRNFAFSNGSFSAVRQLLEHAEITDLFEGIVSAEEIRMFKPSPVIYKHFNDKTGTSKGHTWMISGNSFDVIGALHYGMHAIWVKRSDEHIFDPWDLNPDHVVSGIDELVHIL